MDLIRDLLREREALEEVVEVPVPIIPLEKKKITGIIPEKPLLTEAKKIQN